MGANLIIWQAGDLEGYQATTEMIYNLINAEAFPEGASPAAAAGGLLGCMLWGEEPCPGIVRPH